MKIPKWLWKKKNEIEQEERNEMAMLYVLQATHGLIKQRHIPKKILNPEFRNILIDKEKTDKHLEGFEPTSDEIFAVFEAVFDKKQVEKYADKIHLAFA